MKKNSLSEYILYFIVKAVALIMQTLPYGFGLFLGRRLGLLGLFINPKRKRIAYANLKCALGTKYEPAQIKKILKKTYLNMGQGIAELLLLPKIDKKYANKNFTFEGIERIDKALKKGKGIILLTGHFGNWEMANVALPLKGYTYKAIARQQKPFLINNLLNTYRETRGCKVISKGMPLREIIRALRNNEIVGMLVDQDAGKGGVFVDLFNRPASWHMGVMGFALRTGCEVLPGFIIRRGGAKFTFSAREPIIFPETGTDEEKTKEGFRQFAAYIEGVITKYPDQWLWQHKRWKSSPQRRILILNDGRIGHLRQAQAIFQQLQNVYQDKGISKDNIRVETIDVEFKDKRARQMFYLMRHVSCGTCQGCLRCLKWALTEKSYKCLSRTYADIIISCGAKTAPINIILSKECNGKSIIVMDPGQLLLKKASLGIVPKHDKPKKSKNIVITSGAPNMIDKSLIQRQANALEDEIGPMRKIKIGLLLGGNCKNFQMHKDVIALLIKGVKEAAQKMDADIIATTSRRTPEDVELLLKQELASDSRCKLLVIPNQENKEGVVGGILGLCSVVVVSPESISMISEASSSGSRVLIFDQDNIKDQRHGLFLNNLNTQGYIEFIDMQRPSESIADAIKKGPKEKILNDNIAIREGLERVIGS